MPWSRGISQIDVLTERVNLLYVVIIIAVTKIKGRRAIVAGHVDNMLHPTMIHKNIPFDSEYYPNKNHGIYGGMTRIHLFTRMTNYLLEKL